jgi:hypothetical protein
MFEHFRGDWAYAESNFFDELSKNFFLQNLLFGPIRWVPRRFLKISIIYSQNLVFLSIFPKLYHMYAEHTQKRFYHMLNIRGTDFIAHWANEERISVHAQPAVKCEQFLHTQNKFHRILSICGTDFIACWACAEMFKSRISRPNRIRFSKISCYRPLGPYGFSFCKKIKKKFMFVYL